MGVGGRDGQSGADVHDGDIACGPAGVENHRGSERIGCAFQSGPEEDSPELSRTTLSRTPFPVKSARKGVLLIATESVADAGIKPSAPALTRRRLNCRGFQGQEVGQAVAVQVGRQGLDRLLAASERERDLNCSRSRCCAAR